MKAVTVKPKSWFRYSAPFPPSADWILQDLLQGNHRALRETPVKIAPWLGAVLALGFAVSEASAVCPLGGRFLLDKINRRLHGQVIDYTHNHGQDNRIWSEALQCKRDLYVYLPP